MPRALFTLLAVLLAAGATSAAPVPKALKKQKPLRAKIEPLPKEKLFSVDLDNVPFGKAMEQVEELSGLMYIEKEKPPDLRISLKAEKVCLPELFAQLDDELHSQGWVLVRKSQTFTAMKTETVGRNWAWLEKVTVADLPRRSQYEPVYMYLLVNKEGGAAGLELADKSTAPGFKVEAFGSDQLFVRGRSMDIRKLIDDLGDHVKK